jgi:long-subunit fatty acid transport protein
MELQKRILVGCLLAVCSIAVQAQERPPTASQGGAFSGLPVDLLPPGARALGLAGAFSAVADDATAAVANPAGLTILTSPEISMHFRDTDADIEFLDQEAFNSGFLSNAGDIIKNYEDSSTDVSFASYVKPFERWVFSAYYLNQVDISSQAPTDIVFDASGVDTYTNTNALSAKIESLGVSLAFRVNDFISIGISAAETNIELQSIDLWSVDSFTDLEFLLEDFFGNGTAAEYAGVLTDTFTFGNTVDDEDDDIAFNVGILFNPAGTWSGSIVYREGADFDLRSTSVFRTAFGCTGSGQLADDCADAGILPVSLGNNDGRTDAKPAIPDTLTFGVAWRPTDTLLLSLDLNNVAYDDLTPTRPVTYGFEFDLNNLTDRALFNDPSIVNLQGPVVEEIDDAWTFHFGVEKVFPLSGDGFLSMTTLSLRGGAFTDEDHDGVALIDGDDTHITMGVGATFGNHVQIDLAAEFSDAVDNLVLSGIYRF